MMFLIAALNMILVGSFCTYHYYRIIILYHSIATPHLVEENATINQRIELKIPSGSGEN